MADNTKQGPKDITDLKARLGLKKAGGGPGAAAPGPGVPAPFPASAAGVPGPASRPGQVPLPAALAGPPSSAAGSQGAIPPPPGFAPPPEQAQPDLRRDPYAAQQAAVAANLAAYYTAGGALPGDGDAVKNEPKKPKPWPIIGAAAGAGVLFAFLGFAVGAINSGRNDYNITTEHAVRIRDQVAKIDKQVDKVKEVLKEIKLSDKEAPNFAAIEKLGEIDFKEPDITRDLFHTNYFSFEPTVVQQIFNYYNDTTLLAKQLGEHTARTKGDKDSIEKYVKAQAAKAEKDRPIGVILDYSDKFPIAQLVEILSPPLCPKPEDDACGVEERKMRYRSSLGGEGQARAVKGLPQNIVLAIKPTELQKQVLSGDPAMLAFRDYVRRAAALFQTMARIAETKKQLNDGLQKRAKEAPLFAF